MVRTLHPNLILPNGLHEGNVLFLIVWATIESHRVVWKPGVGVKSRLETILGRPGPLATARVVSRRLHEETGATRHHQVFMGHLGDSLVRIVNQSSDKRENGNGYFHGTIYATKKPCQTI